MDKIGIMAAALLTMLLWTGCRSGMAEKESLKAMEKLSQASLKYAAKHDQMLPEKLEQLKPNYLPPTFDLKPYRMASGRNTAVYSRPFHILFLYDERQLSGGRQTVAFLDERVEIIGNLDTVRQMKRLAVAAIQYAVNNNQMLPMSVYDLKSYLDPSFPLSRYEMLTTGHLKQLKTPHETMLFREKEADRDGNRCAAYVDGHVEVISEK